MTSTLTVSPQEAVFLAGSTLLMLRKGIKDVTGESDRYTQLLGLSLLNRLADYQYADEEANEMLRAAVDAGVAIVGEEVIHVEIMDGIPTADAEKFM